MIQKNLMNKKIYAILVFLTINIATFVGAFTTSYDYVNHSMDSIVAVVPLSKSNALNDILQQRITILEMNRSRTSVVVLVSSEELAWLSSSRRRTQCRLPS